MTTTPRPRAGPVAAATHSGDWDDTKHKGSPIASLETQPGWPHLCVTPCESVNLSGHHFGVVKKRRWPNGLSGPV